MSDPRYADPSLKEAVREEICNRLADGRGLADVCNDKDMPSRQSVCAWMREDDEFALQVTRAREEGYAVRAERAVQDAKLADDAAKGRLAFDAERWYLGKLSNAFSDNKERRIALNAKVERVERLIVDPANPDS